jgi:hypothetical protein
MPLHNCLIRRLYAIGVRSPPSVKTKHNSPVNFYTVLDVYRLSFLGWRSLLHLWRAMARVLGILHFCIPSLLVRLVHESVQPIIYNDSTPRPLNFETLQHFKLFHPSQCVFFHPLCLLPLRIVHRCAAASVDSTMDRSDSSKVTRLDKQFSYRKEEIRQVYSKKGKPLRETMDFLCSNAVSRQGTESLL